MGRRSTSRSPGGTAGSIPQSSIAAGTGAGLFESADGKRVIVQVAAGAPQNNASLADAATETYSYATTTNREHDVTVEFSFTEGSTIRAVQYRARARNVSGTVTVVFEGAVVGPTNYSPALNITLDAAASGTNINFTLLNSTGGALTSVRTRVVADERIDYS